MKAKKIRWSSFSYATNRVRNLYPVIHDSTYEFIKITITKQDLKIAEDFTNRYIRDFNILFMLYWLGDLLQPICGFNESLQSKEFQLAKLKDEINDVIQILDCNYINFHKT